MYKIILNIILIISLLLNSAGQGYASRAKSRDALRPIATAAISIKNKHLGSGRLIRGFGIFDLGVQDFYLPNRKHVTSNTSTDVLSGTTATSTLCACIALIVFDKYGKPLKMTHFFSASFNPEARFISKIAASLKPENHFLIIHGTFKLDQQRAFIKSLMSYLEHCKIAEDHIYTHESKNYNSLLERDFRASVFVTPLANIGVRIDYIDFEKSITHSIATELIQHIENMPDMEFVNTLVAAAKTKSTKSSPAGGDNSQLAAKEQMLHEVAMLTRNIFKEEKEKGRARGGRACQMHAILLNYLLNRAGIKSRVIGLDYKWLQRRWEGLHYCVETEDNIYIDAFPEEIFTNAEISSEILILFPGEDKHDEYSKSKELAASRDWGSIAPENLLEKEYYVTVLKEVIDTYSEKIEKLVKKYGQVQASKDEALKSVSDLIGRKSILTLISSAA